MLLDASSDKIPKGANRHFAKELYEVGNSTFLQREEMLIQHKLEVQKKIEESLKNLEEINYKNSHV